MNAPNNRRDIPGPAPATAPSEVFQGEEIDETFDGRLKQAIVRHFRYAWRELIALRGTLRAEKSASAREFHRSGDEPPPAETLDAGESGPSAPGAGA
ncbi:MAG: hypothetical protein ACKVU1_14895 [bacterium]